MTSFRSLSEALGLEERALVAFVGAGGKTSLMSRLAFELYEDRRKVALTTTTRLASDEVRDFWNASKLDTSGEGEIDEVLSRAVLVSRVPFVYSKALEDRKLQGISLEDAEALYDRVEFLLVEADGGRQASFKIPRPHEPVLPPSTTHLCIVMGAEIFDQPAGRDLFFNFEDLQKIATLKRGVVCPPGLIRKLLFRKNGYLKHAVEGRKTFILLNKVDSAERVDAIMPMADELFHPAVESIILTSHEPGLPVVSVDNSRDRVACVILAAGVSVRFHKQKLCEDLAGESMILRAARSALESQFERVCVVTGYKADEVVDCLDILKSHDDLMIIENKGYSAGMGKSISEGISAVSQWADAAMILPADMPRIDTFLMDKLVETYKSSNARMCLPVFGKRHCLPVIFRKDFFPELAGLKGDEGGRGIVEANAHWAKTIILESEDSQVDIDTVEDLEKMRKIIV